MGVSDRQTEKYVKNYIYENFDASARILDVGAGAGLNLEMLKDRYDNIDCIEVFEPYIETYNLKNRYKKVYHQNVVEFDNFNDYDLIIMGDVLEHLTVEDSVDVLDRIAKSKSEVLIQVPYQYVQGIENENIYEIHIQDDLTKELMEERYGEYLKLLHEQSYLGIYIRNRGDSEIEQVVKASSFKMKKFNHIRDRHFPDGYTDWIQFRIDMVVSQFIDLSEIKTIFDIGSLNGIESVKFTEKLPQDVTVYTFEPNEESYKNVLISTEGNANIITNKLAVSNFNGKSDFYMTYENMGGSSLLEPMILHKTGNDNHKTTVDVVQLSDWCPENNVTSIDLIWMDVQGSEFNVFTGMGDLLKTVKAIYVECSNIPYYHGASHKDDVINYLRGYGLELVDESYHDSYEGDFIFVRK
jgi:FkbM family methyltransferase